MDLGLIKDLGVVTVIALGLMFFIKWITAEFKALLLREASERERWQCIIEKFQETILIHTNKADEFHKATMEEHKNMIETLSRINGYKH